MSLREPFATDDDGGGGSNFPELGIQCEPGFSGQSSDVYTVLNPRTQFVSSGAGSPDLPNPSDPGGPHVAESC